MSQTTGQSMPKSKKGVDVSTPSDRDEGETTVIDIDDRGLVPMPARVTVTRADGTTEEVDVPVDAWLSGGARSTLRVPSRPEITWVAIDDKNAFPDIDRSNQLWRR